MGLLAACERASQRLQRGLELGDTMEDLHSGLGGEEVRKTLTTTSCPRTGGPAEDLQDVPLDVLGVWGGVPGGWLRSPRANPEIFPPPSIIFLFFSKGI